MKYHIFDPSGNITALIPVLTEKECLPETARLAMAREPFCEQVGFVLPGLKGYDIRLQMAGGEFCGNASLCTASYYCLENGITPGESRNVSLLVSGAHQILTCKICCLKEKLFLGTINMPTIHEISDYSFSEGRFPLVAMPGICHVMVPEEFGVERAETCIQDWCSKLSADALGIMLLSADYSHITPLVYVPASATLFRENSCASGSSAVGAWISKKAGKRVSLSFTEPGGVLSVSATPEGEVTLTNHVRLIHAKKI